MNTTSKHLLYLHILVFLLAFTGILGELIKLEAAILVWHRVLIAFVGLLIVLPLLKQKIQIPPLKDLWKIAFVGICVGLHWFTFYKSIQLSTASLGIICLSTTSIHVAWLDPIVNKRKVLPYEFLLSILVVAGIYYIAKDFNPEQIKALIYGLFSAFFAAAFSVFNARYAQRYKSSIISLIELITAWIFLSIVLLFQGRLSPDIFVMTWSDFAWLLFLGLVCTSFAFLATVEIVKHIGAFVVSLTFNLEPVYTILLAIPILKEHQTLDPQFYIGAILIILVLFINATIKSPKFNKKIRSKEKI